MYPRLALSDPRCRLGSKSKSARTLSNGLHQPSVNRWGQEGDKKGPTSTCPLSHLDVQCISECIMYMAHNLKIYQYNAVTIKRTQCSQCLQSRYNLHLPSLSPLALNLGSDQSTSSSSLRKFPVFPFSTECLMTVSGELFRY